MAKTKMACLVVSMSIKADEDPKSRTFEGLASTWEQDLGNDVIHKGAFKDTLKAWKAGGDTIPLLNSHDHWNIMSALGQLVDAKETTDGLWTKWEVLDGPEGDQVLTRLRPSKTTGKPLVSKMSIGYEPVEYSFEQPEGSDAYWDRIRHLQKVNLKEVSLVLFPMNPGASIDSSTVKAFIAATQDTDPQKLSIQTKLELRKLASRIGLLLKKDKDPAPKDADADDDVDEQDPPKPTPTPAPVSDASDEDDADDGADPADLLPEGSEHVEEKEYVFPEALSQRLQKVLLKNKVANITQ